MRTVDFTGTVSQATMRPQDVLPAIMRVLAEYDPDQFDKIVYAIAFGIDKRFTQQQAQVVYSEVLADDDHVYWHDNAGYDLESAFDAMDEIAPTGYYFGAHPGDGCDYGFWRVEPSETGCNPHVWAIVEHDAAGLVWQCADCNCIAEAPVSIRPCTRCGGEDHPPTGYDLCQYCKRWAQ